MAFVSGMFPASKVGKGSFAGSTVAPRKVSKGTTTVMAVDSFQKQFQGFGKIAVDYKKGKRPFEFQRGTSGGSVTSLPFPDNQYFAGIYPISLCRRQTGVKRTLAKAEQMIAMDRFRQAKASATSSGIYNVRCTEGSVPQEAEFKRVFSRTNAFREAQKPINERIRKMYEDRKKMFMMADNSPSAEKKASTMPLVNKVRTTFTVCRLSSTCTDPRVSSFLRCLWLPTTSPATTAAAMPFRRASRRTSSCTSMSARPSRGPAPTASTRSTATMVLPRAWLSSSVLLSALAAIATSRRA